ncbi:stalk domain-containing protein [Paenibacillus arenosi]|uniref:Copper amine oxidase n=1 Tax=Paenibacillus arenosi TaxID=2774142 RepID=A0ABR9B6E1_9BACL|nr:stalk domain-containing protein [Paenibacillus arenosi]MBD8500962.1 copper amine oxidase [Paenibacillus arenosi]
MKKKFVVLLSAVTMLGGMAIGVGAAPVLEKITANLNWGIRYEVNGKQWTPKDQSGNKIAAINYNNTTYLPVRAVSDALGIAVKFDNKTQKITLGEKLATTPLTSEKIDVGYSSVVTTDKQYTVHDGKDYGSGVLMKEINVEQKVTFKPEGKHQTLELSVLPVSVSKEISVKVFNGEVLLKEVFLSPGGSGQSVTLDIKGAKELKVTAKLVDIIGASGTIFLAGTYK